MRLPCGLVPAIVRNCIFAGVAIGGLDETRRTASQGEESDPGRIEAWAFGADVVASLAGLPPVSLVASRGFKWLLSWLRPQGWYIRSNLRRRWPSDPQLVEFLGAWADYLLKPTPEGEADLSSYLNKLATTNRLFDLFGIALQRSGYTTLALVFDEVSPGALDGLKTLWDPQVHAAGQVDQKINLMFVLAAKDAVYEAALADPALKRRFCDPPCVRSPLPGPTVHSRSSRDDFDHAVEKINDLLARAAHLRRPQAAAANLPQVRGRLSRIPNLTWQTLWHEVIGTMTTL